jgi:predicted MFS family arabinose efflux permease
VPLGGVIAGLSIPLLVESVGWRMALVIAAVAAITATVLMRPFQPRIDGPRDRTVATRLISFRLTDIAVPLRSLSRGRGLWRIAWVGSMLAIPQACWVTFAATYLVVGLGLSLSVAGLVFAVMQASSVAGRIILGWIADHAASSTATLVIASVASAASTIAFGLVGADWPVWSLVLLAAVAGISVSGWNGVQIAEVARRSSPEYVGETAAGAVILVFLSNMLGPVAFATFIAVTNRFDLAFMAAGAVSLLCLPLLHGIDRVVEKSGH